jgi:hypothetical protein
MQELGTRPGRARLVWHGGNSLSAWANDVSRSTPRANGGSLLVSPPCEEGARGLLKSCRLRSGDFPPRMLRQVSPLEKGKHSVGRLCRLDRPRHSESYSYSCSYSSSSSLLPPSVGRASRRPPSQNRRATENAEPSSSKFANTSRFSTAQARGGDGRSPRARTTRNILGDSEVVRAPRRLRCQRSRHTSNMGQLS